MHATHHRVFGVGDAQEVSAGGQSGQIERGSPVAGHDAVIVPVVWKLGWIVGLRAPVFVSCTKARFAEPGRKALRPATRLLPLGVRVSEYTLKPGTVPVRNVASTEPLALRRATLPLVT